MGDRDTELLHVNTSPILPEYNENRNWTNHRVELIYVTFEFVKPLQHGDKFILPQPVGYYTGRDGIHVLI